MVKTLPPMHPDITDALKRKKMDAILKRHSDRKQKETDRERWARGVKEYQKDPTGSLEPDKDLNLVRKKETPKSKLNPVETGLLHRLETMEALSPESMTSAQKKKLEELRKKLNE